MRKNLYIFMIIFIFTSILKGTDEFPYYLGKWNGVTPHNDKNITIEFLPRSINISTAHSKRSSSYVEYIKSEDNSVIVEAKMNFGDILNTKAKQFKILKKDEAIYITNLNGSILGKFYSSKVGKFPYFLGKWDGTTEYNRDVEIKFLPQSIEITIYNKKTFYKNIKYSKLNYYNTLVESEIDFDAINIKSNQFVVRDSDQKLRLKKINGSSLRMGNFYQSDKDKLVNGWDMESYSSGNKRSIFPVIGQCYESMKEDSDLYGRFNGKFSFQTLKQSKNKLILTLTNFDIKKAGRLKKIPDSIIDTIEYKTIHKCTIHFINTYSPSELKNKIYKDKESRQLIQEFKEFIE